MALMEISDQLYSNDPGENPPPKGPDYELDIPHEVALPDDMIFPSKPPLYPTLGSCPFPVGPLLNLPPTCDALVTSPVKQCCQIGPDFLP